MSRETCFQKAFVDFKRYAISNVVCQKDWAIRNCNIQKRGACTRVLNVIILVFPIEGIYILRETGKENSTGDLLSYGKKSARLWSYFEHWQSQRKRVPETVSLQACWYEASYKSVLMGWKNKKMTLCMFGYSWGMYFIKTHFVPMHMVRFETIVWDVHGKDEWDFGNPMGMYKKATKNLMSPFRESVLSTGPSLYALKIRELGALLPNCVG